MKNLKICASYVAVVALVVTLGFAASGTAFAQTTTTAGVTNYSNTTSTTTSVNGTGTTTSNLNLFIFGVNGANPSGTTVNGSVLGASTVGMPNTGTGGEATATWTIIAAFLLVLATLGIVSRKNA